MIPRIRGYGSNTPSRSFSMDQDTKGGARSPEAALVDILDGDQHGHQTQEIESVHSFGRGLKKTRQFGDELRERSNSRSCLHQPSTSRGRSAERLDHNSQDLASDIEATHSIKYGTRLVSI